MQSLMRFTLTAFAAAVMLLAALSPVSAQESKPLTFCNKTSVKVYLTIGYYTAGVNDTEKVLTGPFVSRGYWSAEPGACQTLENPFQARYMFWFGFNIPSEGRFNSDDFSVYLMSSADAPIHFCVPNIFEGVTSSFTFEDENASLQACQRTTYKNGYSNMWVIPRKVDTWVDAAVNFTGE